MAKTSFDAIAICSFCDRQIARNFISLWLKI